MDSQRLLSAVEAAFVTTGADTPPWPDPHQGTRQPSEEEYSRCLDPGKYRILRARADAWLEALAALGLADAEHVDDPAPIWRDEPAERSSDRAVLLRPHIPGAIPLVLAFRSIQGVPDTVVDIGACEPAVLVESVPDCGCDACDDGSGPMLGVLDEYVLAIVNGELIHVKTTAHTIMATASRRSAHGRMSISRQSVDEILTEARQGRSRHHVVTGSRWW